LIDGGSRPDRDSERVARIRDAASRVAGSYGLEIFDVQLRRESAGWVLRILIDHPADHPETAAIGAPADSIGVGECERISRDLSALFDVEDLLDRSYTLEVSSPGLDRPLRHAGDFRRFAGRLAKIVVAEAVDGQKHFAGRLMGVESDEVLIRAEGNKPHRIPVGLIKRARLEVEF
jgi:ribosome maturation factor RimP